MATAGAARPARPWTRVRRLDIEGADRWPRRSVEEARSLQTAPAEGIMTLQNRALPSRREARAVASILLDPGASVFAFLPAFFWFFSAVVQFPFDFHPQQ